MRYRLKKARKTYTNMIRIEGATEEIEFLAKTVMLKFKGPFNLNGGWIKFSFSFPKFDPNNLKQLPA